MFGIILLLALSAEALKQTSILTPPSDLSGKKGETAEFKCEVDLDDIASMSWEFNNAVIYLLYHKTEDYPKGKAKYSVAQEGMIFTLKVKDLDYSDGGKYNCLVSDQSEEASLVVLGEPQLSTSPTNLVEGNPTEFICTAQFAGPRKKEISFTQYPQLQMFFDGEALNGTVREQEFQAFLNGYNLTQNHTLTLEPSMNGKILFCKITTSNPAMQLNVSTQLEVLYGVSLVDYSPKRTQYDIGTAINCTADGNPKPNFIWSDRNSGNETHGHLLTITDQMVGSNEWMCTATNSINGQSHEENVVAAFNVVPPPVSETAPSSESGSDSWKIAVGLTIPVILLVVVIAVCYRYTRRIIYEHIPTEEGTMMILLDSATKRNEQLLETISKLKGEYDLSDEVVEKIKDLLPNLGQTFPSDPGKQSALVRFIRKSKYLIGSESYFPLMESMVNIYKRNQDQMQEDPLLYLVEKIEKEPFVTHNHERLLKILQIIMPLQSSAATRSRCMWVLMTSTTEWKMYKGETLVGDSKNNNNRLHWTEGFIDILKVLLEHGADPSWSPAGSSEGSSLRVVLLLIHQVLTMTNLLSNLLELLEAMIEHPSISCRDVDAERKTVLHSLVARMKNESVRAHAVKLHKLVLLCKKKNPDILNAADRTNCTPLHTFLTSVFPENKTELTEDLMIFENDIASLLITKTNVNMQMKNSKTILHEVVDAMSPNLSREINEQLFELLKSLKSHSNVDIPDVQGNTALHIFTLKGGKWPCYAELFSGVVESLRSPTNINLENKNKQTALCIFTGFASDWVNHAENFQAVVDKLVSDVNITFKDGKGLTALEIFSKSGNLWKDGSDIFVKVFKRLVPPASCINNKEGKTVLDLFNSWAADLAYHPDAFLEIVKILKSSGTLDIQDTDGTTILHKCTLWAHKWKHHPDTIFEILEVFKDSIDLDIKNENGNTALHRFTFQADKWKSHPGIFLEVVKLLKLPTNIDHKNNYGNTPLHRFTEKAGEWTHHLEEYKKVVKCLKSTSNIDVPGGKGETPLLHFVETVGGHDHPDSYLQIVKLLASPNNINFKKNLSGDTVLHTFTSKASEWIDHPGKFLEVVNYLKSSTNMEIKNMSSDTALHLFISEAGIWKDPKDFLEVVKCLSSSTNIEVKNGNGDTALHMFTSKPGEWKKHPEAFLKVVDHVKSSTNIDITNEKHETPLQVFISKAGDWKEHQETLLAVIDILKSPTNLEVKNILEETALQDFISQAREWTGHAQAFLEVVKCLASSTNIISTNTRGATALHDFVSYVAAWQDYPEDFLKVVEFLVDIFPQSIDLQDINGDTVLHYLFFSFMDVDNNRDLFLRVAKRYAEFYSVSMETETGSKSKFICSLKAKYGVVREPLLDFFTKFSTDIKVIYKKAGEIKFQIFTSSTGRWANSEVFLEVVRCLSSPKNIKCSDQDGDTALHWLARCKSEWANHSEINEIVKCLMSSGNIQIKNNDGNTALDLFRKNWGTHAQPILDIASSL